jgi:nitrogen fixation NifU-like protein
MRVDALYREYIIDHYKNPRNFGELDERDAEFEDRNPLCGDELGVQIKLEGDRVSDLRFHGRGCAISQAAASIISDELKGKTVTEIAALDRHFVVDELGIDLSPTRLKCGLLSLKVVQGALLGTEEWPRGAQDAVDVTPEEAARMRSEV